MGRWARIATAAALTAALAGLPVVLDQCTASCEAHQTDAAAAPPCHHTQSTGAQIGHVPAACNHEHTASIGALPGTAPVAPRAVDATTVAATPIVPANRPALDIVSTHAPPGSAGPIHASSLPLRV